MVIRVKVNLLVIYVVFENKKISRVCGRKTCLMVTT